MNETITISRKHLVYEAADIIVMTHKTGHSRGKGCWFCGKRSGHYFWCFMR